MVRAGAGWWEGEGPVLKLCDFGLTCPLNNLRHSLDMRCVALLMMEVASGQRGEVWEPCRVHAGGDKPLCGPLQEPLQGPLQALVDGCWGHEGRVWTAHRLQHWATQIGQEGQQIQQPGQGTEAGKARGVT